jgi:hypothetical protein
MSGHGDVRKARGGLWPSTQLRWVFWSVLSSSLARKQAKIPENSFSFIFPVDFELCCRVPHELNRFFSLFLHGRRGYFVGVLVARLCCNRVMLHTTRACAGHQLLYPFPRLVYIQRFIVYTRATGYLTPRTDIVRGGHLVLHYSYNPPLSRVPRLLQDVL